MRTFNKVTATAPSLRAAATAFSGVKMGPADPILGLSSAFNEDANPTKVNLGVGVYRDDKNKPHVLECVRQAGKSLEHYSEMEYAPITGVPGFVTKAQWLAFGDAAPTDRLASSQSLSGTGALRVAADFLSRHGPVKTIYIPNPSWGNHRNIFRDAGLEVKEYGYYNKDTKAISVDTMISDIEAAPEGSNILLHACAHNPTGMDPTQAEWAAVFDAIARRHHTPLVDMAYQGFASGDTDRDAFVIRELVKKVPNMFVCQSMAKNFGLYGHRCGAVHAVCADNAERGRVLSQLKILIRPMYSSPPLFGARIVERVLNDAALTKMWRGELLDMSGRMNGVRSTLVSELEKAGSVRNWEHITKQIGMMAFTGFTKEQVAELKADHHIYMTEDGRAAISGLNTSNVEYVAKAFHTVSAKK